MHIDSSFAPLAPGKVLVNPDYVNPAVLGHPGCTPPDPTPLSASRWGYDFSKQGRDFLFESFLRREADML